MKKILFIFAHPDDESFLTGGTIKKYSDLGTEIHLLCLTKGEAGSTGSPPICSQETLSIIRSQELENARQHLGIHFTYLLDYQDGNLFAISTETIVNTILLYLKAIEPDVIVTFPEHGVSGHKDHIRTYEATLLAVQKSEVSAIKKVYLTSLPDSLKDQYFIGHITDEDERITTTIDCMDYRENVRKALLEHKTQKSAIEKCFPGIYHGVKTAIPNKNFYILAYQSKEIETVFPEDDLFSGIDDNTKNKR